MLEVMCPCYQTPLPYQLTVSYGSRKFEGVLHIVVRSWYERDLAYP